MNPSSHSRPLLHDLGGLFSGREDRSPPRRLLIEMALALLLSTIYFFLVKSYAMGASNNLTNNWVFSSCSYHAFHLNELYPVWKGRLSGLLLSGCLCDMLGQGDLYSIDRFAVMFGLYQGLWLFLLFLVVILALRRSLFINLGIFAGLIYNFLPASGLYFYPWDIPATLFFTLAVLFFERRQMLPMVAATCAGCFFKETVLVCALLVLFAGQWQWWKRILTFAGIVAVYVLGKRFLLALLQVKAAALSMNDATNLAGVLNPAILSHNIHELFSPITAYVIFANAGTLLAVLLFGWRRRFLPFMTLIVVYVAGQAMYGAFHEFRIFMQILPLSLILLSERWWRDAGPDVGARLHPEMASPGRGGWAARKTFPALLPVAIVLIGLSTGVVAWRFYNTLEWQADAELKTAVAFAELGNVSGAIKHYHRVLELNTNSVAACNNLSWLLATAPDSSLRNGNEAVRLAERACQLTQYKKAFMIGTLAAAYAQAGRFNDAVAAAQKARTVALADGQKDIAAANERLLELYKSGRAYHQETKATP